MSGFLVVSGKPSENFPLFHQAVCGSAQVVGSLVDADRRRPATERLTGNDHSIGGIAGDASRGESSSSNLSLGVAFERSLPSGSQDLTRFVHPDLNFRQ